MPGYWTNDGGLNMLKGVPGDADNPPRMTDELILYTIQHSRAARVEFDQILPSLLPDEQDRLTTLVADNPYRSRLLESYQTREDRIQSNAIRSIPVRTSGPRGGVGPSQVSVRR